MKSKNIIRPALVTLAILIIPVLGNQFINGWDWSVGDFIVMGLLIFGTGLMVELANRKIKNKDHRIIAIALIILALVWLWVELAVGLFTNRGS
jgi:Kef-type K+ transport system membrane component KefB